MLFENLLKRANLNNLETFLWSGGVCERAQPEESYRDRIRAAEQKMERFLKTHFPDKMEFEAANDIWSEVNGVYMDIYFEVGLLLGAKIALQINSRLEELS